MIEQQRTELNKLKEQLETLYRIDQLTTEHTSSINELTKRATQNDEQTDQLKKVRIVFEREKIK